MLGKRAILKISIISVFFVILLVGVGQSVFSGTSWSAQTSGTTGFLWSVDLVDASTGYAVGNDGTILKTTDGGTTWNLASGTTSSICARVSDEQTDEIAI